MKKINNGAENFFISGYSIYSLFGRATECDSICDFLTNESTDNEDRRRLWKVVQLFSLAVIVEHYLIDNMDKQFKKFNALKQDEIRSKIIKRISKEHEISNIDAEKKLDDQMTLSTGNISRNIVNTPVIQYLAGYTMGGLIHFAHDNFNIPEDIFEKFEEFNEERNYVVHNSTSSRDDIDVRLENGIKIGKELKDNL